MASPLPRSPARLLRRLLGLLAAALASGCALLPVPQPLPAGPTLVGSAPARWQVGLPHAGDPAQLLRWWQQFDDPLLAELVGAAQAQSATLAAASARLAQARAARVAAGAALGPQLDGSAGASRSRLSPGLPVASSLSAGLQASWELDLFGGQGAARDAAQARLEGAGAGWHDARVAVAAEVASLYIGLRACEALLVQGERDAASRAETARLAELAARAGFQAPADAALSRASAAQARATLAARRAACASELKALVATTGLDEPGLRSRLEPGRARVPQWPAATSPLGPASVPAQALAQRPDLRAAEAELLAVAADVGQSEAQRLPRITLVGNIGAGLSRSADLRNEGLVWSLGPLQFSLPLFDGGTRRANVAAARARYDEAAAAYRARVRTAVREAEDALLRLQSSSERAGDAQIAAEGFDAALRAADARYRGGLGSLFELEDARRSAVQAQVGLIELARERSTAWVQLYRALGGGWSDADLAP